MISETVKDFYKTISHFHREEQKISNSKFIASVFPVSSKEEVERSINSIRNEFFNAKHHPYVYKLGLKGDNFKISDDGEPSGSSGKPILNAINKYELTNIVLIVTRYFGGTKLGLGGLKQAYFSIADLCLSKCEILEKFIKREIYTEFEYSYLNSVMHLLNGKKIKINENWSDTFVKMSFNVRLSLLEELTKELINLTRGNIKILVN